MILVWKRLKRWHEDGTIDHWLYWLCYSLGSLKTFGRCLDQRGTQSIGVLLLNDEHFVVPHAAKIEVSD